MSIRFRIVGSSIIMVALFVLMGGINWFGSRAVMSQTDLAYRLEEENMHLQGLFRGINEFIIDEGEPLSIELTNKHLKGFDNIHASLLSHNSIDDTSFNEALKEKIDPQWKAVKKGAEAFIKDNPWISVEDDKAMLQYGKLTTEAKKLLNEVQLLAEATRLSANLKSEKTQKTVMIIAAVILLLIVFLLFNLYRSITAPIRDLSNLAQGFNQGNLGVRMNSSGKDEFGIVASALNGAIAKLGEMIANMKMVINTLYENSGKLSNSASVIADNAREQAGQTNHAFNAIGEISSSFQTVADNTAKAAGSSQEATELAFKSADIISGTVSSMNTISEAAEQSAGTIEELEAGSRQIGEIIKVIDDIAGQTNLLALNAAIEAARAGEQGRGFAVVADEVRKLAEKTTASTGEIGDMIKNIQKKTTDTVTSMQGWTSEIKAGLDLANQAGNALQMIVVTVNGVTDKVHQVAAAAEEQSSTATEISSNVESVSKLTEETAASAVESSSATQNLNVLVETLQNLIETFTLESTESIDQDMHPADADDHNTTDKGSMPGR